MVRDRVQDGARLARIREGLGISQAALARGAGRSKVLLWGIEHGLKSFSAATRVRAARFLAAALVRQIVNPR